MDAATDAHYRQFVGEDQVLNGLLRPAEINRGVPDAQQRWLDLWRHVLETLDNLLLDTFRDFGGE